jgi:hypothetical protein
MFEKWHKKSYKQILFTRLYGLVLVVLIFTPILNWIFSYNLFYIYLIIVLMSMLQELTLKGFFDKYIKYLRYILFLDLDIQTSWLLASRRVNNIICLILQKNLNKENNKFIVEFSLNINVIYDLLDHKIIDFESFLLDSKIEEIEPFLFFSKKKYMVLDNFIRNIELNLSEYLEGYGLVLYLKYQKEYELLIEEKEKIKEIEIFIWFLIKLLIVYLSSIQYIVRNRIEIDSLIIENKGLDTIFVDYNCIEELSYKELQQLENIKFFNIDKNWYFYEEMYVFKGILSFTSIIRFYGWEHYDLDYLQLLKIKIKNENILNFVENFYIKDLSILKIKFKYNDNLMQSYYRSCLQEGVQDAICENINKRKDLIINELNEIVNKSENKKVTIEKLQQLNLNNINLIHEYIKERLKNKE